MPFIKSNVHTHTTFCDGQDSMEDMVKAAVSLGFDTLGFSFHSYTPFDPSYCIRDYYEYMREFERLRKSTVRPSAFSTGLNSTFTASALRCATL